MNTLQTLYCKKATGKMQKWSIYATEEDNKVYLFTEYGEVDGKQIKRKSQVKDAKANRSLLEEALKQAETKYNHKINKEGYTTDLSASTMNIVVRPMLANKFNPDKTNMVFPCLGEPKYDGNRAIIYMKEEDVIIESRSGTQIYFFNHIREDIRDFFKNMDKTVYLDGELFTHDLTFNVINGLCNRKPSNSKQTVKKIEQNKLADIYMKKVKYYIFDIFNTNNLSLILEERKKIITTTFATCKKRNGGIYKNIIPVEGHHIESIKDVKIKHDEYVNNGGYEGIMLRAYGSKYELKKRSRYLQKYKEFCDEEFVINGYDEDVDGGVVWVCETNIEPKTKFNVRPRGDMEYRCNMYKNASKYIGAKLIVVYQEYTDDKHGVPRFPVGKDFRNIQDLD